MAAPLVIGLGALNVDRIFRVKELVFDGESSVEESGAFPGGSAANTIHGLARLGIATGFCGAIGDDEDGQALLATFSGVGTDTSRLAVKKGAASGMVLCLSDGEHRSLYVMPGANGKLGMKDLDMRYLNSCRWLHVTSFVDDAQFVLTKKAVAALSEQVKLSFSPGSLYAARGLESLRPIIKRTHILFLSRGEAEKLTGQGMAEAARACLDAGCRTVAVTLGKGEIVDGARRVACVLSMDGFAVWITAGKKTGTGAVDTTGAGDAFAAGFLFGQIQGKDNRVCGELGNTAARLSLRYCGARKGLPSKQQLLRQHRLIYP
jgi:ribokinase